MNNSRHFSFMRVLRFYLLTESRLLHKVMEHLPFNLITLFMSLSWVLVRVVLDSWVVSQIWLDSDSNESSQSRVGRENPGYESSQSRVTLIVIWVRVESTRYCLSQSWVNDFSRRKRQDLAVVCNFTEKEPTYSYIRPHPPPPPSTTFSQIR